MCPKHNEVNTTITEERKKKQGEAKCFTLLKVGLQSKPAVAQFSAAQAETSVCHIESALRVGGSQRESAWGQEEDLASSDLRVSTQWDTYGQKYRKLPHMHRKYTERHLGKREQILREGCQKAITLLSAQAMSGVGISLNVFSKLSSFKEIQVETDCSYLKGGEKGRSTGLCSSSVRKSDLAGRGK